MRNRNGRKSVINCQINPGSSLLILAFLLSCLHSRETWQYKLHGKRMNGSVLRLSRSLEGTIQSNIFITPIIYNKSSTSNNSPGKLQSLKEAINNIVLYNLLRCIQWSIEVPKLFIVQLAINCKGRELCWEVISFQVVALLLCL